MTSQVRSEWFDSWGEGPFSTSEVNRRVTSSSNPMRTAREFHQTVGGQYTSFADVFAQVGCFNLGGEAPSPSFVAVT